VVAQDVAVLAGARLGLVRVAQDVLLHVALGHERPLQPGRKAGAATAAQRALFDRINNGRRVRLFGQDLLPRLVAVHLEIVLQRPRLVEVQRGVDDLMWFGFGTVCHGNSLLLFVGAAGGRERGWVCGGSVAGTARSYRTSSISIRR